MLHHRMSLAAGTERRMSALCPNFHAIRALPLPSDPHAGCMRTRPSGPGWFPGKRLRHCCRPSRARQPYTYSHELLAPAAVHSMTASLDSTAALRRWELNCRRPTGDFDASPAIFPIIASGRLSPGSMHPHRYARCGTGSAGRRQGRHYVERRVSGSHQGLAARERHGSARCRSRPPLCRTRQASAWNERNSHRPAARGDPHEQRGCVNATDTTIASIGNGRTSLMDCATTGAPFPPTARYAG